MIKKEMWNAAKGKVEFEKIYQKPHCIALDSEYCSMGRMIAVKACEKAGYTYYDASDLLDLTDGRLSEKQLVEWDAKISKEGVALQEIRADKEFQNLAKCLFQAVEKALKLGPCLIHERISKDWVVEHGYSCTAVMIYATDYENKISRVKVEPRYMNLETEEELEAALKKEDNKRRNYHNFLTGELWGKKESYDLLLNSESLGLNKCVEVLSQMMC